MSTSPVNITRLVTPDDAPALAEVLTDIRDYLAPWEPIRDDDYFSVAGQRDAVRRALDLQAQGLSLPHVIVDEQDRPIGGITLNSIVRGAFQSCSVGYWVSESAAGQGIATRALGEMVRLAFASLDLHRVQGEVVTDNHRSQRVLERNGFERYGLAPSYLKIAGQWQDCVLFQRIRSDEP